MKPRGILFSAPMVRALLAGAKTQTRRLYKPRYPSPYEIMDETSDGVLWPFQADEYGDYYARSSPFGVCGDRLWVRETILFDSTDGEFDRAVYAADSSPTKLDTWPWKRKVLPAIHCPRGLSRLALEVTKVRVQRLQDISEDDARAEGAKCLDVASGREAILGDGSYRDHFRHLWDSINAERCAWESNPWVWAISFKRVEP